MSVKRNKGELGEKEVVKLIDCPNCKKELMQLPKNYPLYDIQCTGCSFRAQVKSISSKPKKKVFWSRMGDNGKSAKIWLYGSSIIRKF